MFARLSMIWNRLRTGLWALPITIVLAAFLLAVFAVSVSFDPGDVPAWWLYSGDASAASGFLANLLTAMITMATLAISITMVVLALAAQSLGPRLIQIFMADTRTKLALGLFIGTVVYLLIVLRSVVGDTESVPNLAVTLGAALVVTSVIVLLFFVHHLARSIVADTIIGRVGDALDGWIPDRFPQKEAGGSDPSAISVPPEANGKQLRARATGYIQAVDHEAAVDPACAAGVTVALHCRPGHFVLRDDIIAWLWPPELVDDDLEQALLETIVVGQTRTPVQDIEYPIRQLVEIALRALSPGVNDPGTAVNIIVVKQRLLSLWASTRAEAGDPAPACPRVSLPALEPADMFDDAFAPLLRDGARMIEVGLRLQDTLAALAAIGPAEFSAAALGVSERALAHADAALALKSDRRRLAEAAERIGDTRRT
jgi:uncharacterized membrane protein